LCALVAWAAGNRALKADHKEIRDLFREFQASGEKAVKKAEIVGQILELLTVYPEVRALLRGLEEEVLES
jgi:hypothetical protein